MFFTFSMVADLLSPNRYHWWIAEVKNCNLNVTEILVSDFKNAFFGIFKFTGGILFRKTSQFGSEPSYLTKHLPIEP